MSHFVYEKETGKISVHQSKENSGRVSICLMLSEKLNPDAFESPNVHQVYGAIITFNLFHAKMSALKTPGAVGEANSKTISRDTSVTL